MTIAKSEEAETLPVAMILFSLSWMEANLTKLPLTNNSLLKRGALASDDITASNHLGVNSFSMITSLFSDLIV